MGVPAASVTPASRTASGLSANAKVVGVRSFRNGCTIAEGFLRSRYHGKCGPYGCQVRAIDREINDHV
eukprot:CAMPEP_0172657638 /NCGR_PEP_ID=MMETSP1074-20121228/2221_1 /TAXON_ID=2916 /ORGANISM="Ceratium fusus, Strain PA161109" /LENGTH=67 /DNA_ID=CAMNT_0013472751 /DNA_START=41 /DNA_END=240 /DNA_ORIENTATION=-